MTGATKLALLPLVVLWLWALPRDQPNTEVAAALVTAAVDVGDAAPDFDAETSTTATPETSTTATPETSTSTGSTSTVSTDTSVVVVVEDPTTTTGLSAAAPVVDAASASDTSSTSESPTTAPETTAAPATTSSIVTTTSSAVDSAAGARPPEALATVPIGQLALDRMSFDWRITFPAWRVEFLGPREGLRALTYPSEKKIEIFVRVDDTAETLHRVFAHELGHVFDVELNDDADRARWVAQRDLPASAPWWPSAAAPDFATGAGDFAEAFAVWETGVMTRSSIGDQPTSDDLALLLELMRG